VYCPSVSYYGFVKVCLEEKLGKSTVDIRVLGVGCPGGFTTLSFCVRVVWFIGLFVFGLFCCWC
jgi:hypothetical protein